ncbi:thiamine pyrophosphate-binding protein [Parafrigoribacterium mesophilum]|uniref:thiamine pyrophosphate-binding protein n=1 Tax=Parafrigoribacterium mesophilum TaxID=433646 RepID=UPI0031FDD7D4
MKVAEAVGKALAAAGIGHIFGVVGSGNFRVTNAMVGEGVPFTASRHESGAALMADAYTRMSGRTAVLTVHQGPGFTNALTGITEAAKSHTPMLVLAPHAPDSLKASNFWVDQTAMALGAGCVVERIQGPGSAVDDALGALARARDERCTVVLIMPNEIQEDEFQPPANAAAPAVPGVVAGASPEEVSRLVGLLGSSDRPVFIAGRGGLGARDELLALAESSGALLATSAVARGLFSGEEWNLDVSGGFATPAATALIAEADLLVVWGASLNRWTTSNGALLKGSKTVVQIDDRPNALGLHYPVDVGIVADVAETARQVQAAWASAGEHGDRYRTPDVARRIEEAGDWRLVEYDEVTSAGRIDPRTLTIALDEILPMDRVVVPDGGNFNGYPAMYFRVPDQHGYCLPLAFASIGLGLSSAIGAAIAVPDRAVITGVGDGGFLMSLVELDTAVRLGLRLVVVVYNDDAYGAEVHHFGPEGVPLDIVQFPPTDIASIARGFGCDALTVTEPGDISKVQEWLDGPQNRPLVIDAKITSFLSWVSKHAFSGPGF